MGMLKEFKEFAMRGNVMDLAIGVVIGGAFGKIVTSLVGDVIMPLVNPMIPGGDWKAIEVGSGIKIGAFLGTIVDFIIIAFAIFMLIKALNYAAKRKKAEEKAQEEAAAPAGPTQEQLLTEIRDLLKNKP